MSREEELTSVREQVGILAEQVGRLLDVISRQTEKGADSGLAEEKLAVLETLMWKLHARHNRLKSTKIVMH
jgi:hypothetical protein